MDEERILTDGPENKKDNDNALHQTDYMCQEKKGEVDSPALKIAWMRQYDDSKTTKKKSKERLITMTRKSTDNIKIKKQQ